MRRKLQNMLETWSEAGMHIRLSLVTGEVVTGRLEELDSDEAVIEPVVEGETWPLTVVLLDHVVTASYLEPGTEEEAVFDDVGADETSGTTAADDTSGGGAEVGAGPGEVTVVSEE